MTPNTAPALPEEELSESSNTIGVNSVLDAGDLAEVRMILGDRDRVKHAGVIRPGIKIPLQSCTKEQIATYHEMLDAGAGFGVIDKKLVEMRPKNTQGRDARSWLRPANADHFTIRPEDFRRPGDAERLVRDYQDADGKVRRLPVWFALGEIHRVIPHNYRGFSGGGIVRFSSSYAPDGNLRCRYLPQGAKVPGKDAYQERACPGLDDPQKCEDYKAKRCAFGGLIRCNVPGVSGVGEVIVPTQSWNGLGESIANLRRVRDVFGRFHGLFHGGPFLELVKVREMVRTAEGKRQEQWVIVVEPSVPIEELAAAREQEGPERARAALAIFAQRSTPSRVGVPVSPPPAEPEPTEPETNLAPGEIDPKVEEAVAYIEKLASHYGLPMAQVRVYASLEHGLVVLETAEVETLRGLAKTLKEKAKADLDDLRAVLADLSRGPMP